MTRRALLIGSETLGLSGVHRDVLVLSETLRQLHFDVRTVMADEATTVGIRAAYGELIESCSGDDAAVVYYSGHGGRLRNRRWQDGSDLPRWLQYIVPADFEQPGESGFAGILAEELSVLQSRLTERTWNTTTILDCCHSARMSRSVDAVPRALTEREIPWEDVLHRWDRVRDAGYVARDDANPHAVQLVACAPDQSAYELPNVGLGGTHGALTAALVEVLRRPEAPMLSWREVIQIVRPRVLDVVPSQRPDLLGPNGARTLFTLFEKNDEGVLPVSLNDGALWLEGAALFGIAEADAYLLRAPGVAQPLADATVEAIVGDRARLSLTPPMVSEVPPGLLAYPVEVSLGRRPIAISPPEHPGRDFIMDALRKSSAVLVVPPGSGATFGTLALDDKGILLLDAAGEPVTSTHRPITQEGIRLLERSLVTLARATHLRELESGAGPASLTDDVAVGYGRIDQETGEEIPVITGEHLYVGDALVIRARNTAGEKRYVSVMDIGLTGAVTILTTAEPSGATLESGEELILGQDPAGIVRGIGLFWPEGLPRTSPRPESLLTLVTDRPIAGLWSLEQEGVKTRASSPMRTGGLEMLIEDIAAGTRELWPAVSAVDQVRYRVKCLDFVLHPQRRPTGSQEPSFEIDNRPDQSFRLLAPRSLQPAPEQVSVRLTDLFALSNQSLFRAKVRVDTLFITAGANERESVQAQTFVMNPVEGGDRTPLSNALLFEGPVRRFLDVAIWVSSADEGKVELAELLAGEMGAKEVVSALTTLEALSAAAPAAAAIAGSAAAIAAIIRTGERLLNASTGTSIGVYRTSFLPHERYGAGKPDRRYPARGTIEAQGLSLAYEIIDPNWGSMPHGRAVRTAPCREHR